MSCYVHEFVEEEEEGKKEEEAESHTTRSTCRRELLLQYLRINYYKMLRGVRVQGVKGILSRRQSREEKNVVTQISTVMLVISSFVRCNAMPVPIPRLAMLHSTGK